MGTTPEEKAVKRANRIRERIAEIDMRNALAVRVREAFHEHKLPRGSTVIVTEEQRRYLDKEMEPMVECRIGLRGFVMDDAIMRLLLNTADETNSHFGIESHSKKGFTAWFHNAEEDETFWDDF